jgi:predicted nucleic acid-binding protein
MRVAALPFLDTNVLLRHLLQDDPAQSPRSTAFLAKIEGGDARVRIADTVVFETVFTLQRQYHVPKGEIREKVLALIELPGVLLPGKRRLREVFDLYVDLNVSFIDAYHAVLMKGLGLDEIASFDRGIDRIPGLHRFEP